MDRIRLEPVDGVRLTILVDNLTDPLLRDVGAVARHAWPKALAPGAVRARSQVMVEGWVPDALIAEPGFSALVRITKGGRERTVLFDTGVSPAGMVENMRRLGIAPGDIDVVVLSHGHWDHVTGMEGLVKALGRVNLPVLIHPEFWSRRRITFPGLDPAELPSTSRSALAGAGFEIVEDRRSCLTARPSSRGRSTEPPSSRSAFRGTRRSAVQSGSPTPSSSTTRRSSSRCAIAGWSCSAAADTPGS
jgi:7,8-dihydropterin-6-yl-methyl-4-(beta-D-ribofuranosyl)aminobenzene 5'-phosphate synthase